eukprot:SAG11_NODE_34428_length_272_cov_0.595376_1_plen_35_part_10
MAERTDLDGGRSHCVAPAPESALQVLAPFKLRLML